MPVGMEFKMCHTDHVPARLPPPSPPPVLSRFTYHTACARWYVIRDTYSSFLPRTQSAVRIQGIPRSRVPKGGCALGTLTPRALSGIQSQRKVNMREIL